MNSPAFKHPQDVMVPDRKCGTRSITSAASSVAATIKALEAYPEFERLNEYTQLVPVDDARRVLELVDARDVPCVSHVSHGYVSRLMGFYPVRGDMTDPATYIAGMTALFCAYPEDFVKRVCDPVTGLPAQHKWLPTLKETRDALDQERGRRLRIVFNATWTIKEAARRAKEAREAEFYKPGTSEERAAAVARHLTVRAM